MLLQIAGQDRLGRQQLHEAPEPTTQRDFAGLAVCVGLSRLRASSGHRNEGNPGSRSLWPSSEFDIMDVAAFAEATDRHAIVPDGCSV